MIDYASKIEFWEPHSYAKMITDPTASGWVPEKTISGNIVLGCELPVFSIKPQDSFFANDSQELEIIIQHDGDDLFFGYMMLKVPSLIWGLYTNDKNYQNIIVCIYDKAGSRFFDGVLMSRGKKYNANDDTIKFKAADFLSIAKWGLESLSTIPASSISVKTTFESIIKSIYYQFGFDTTPNPIQIEYDAVTKPLQSYTNQKIKDVTEVIYRIGWDHDITVYSGFTDSDTVNPKPYSRFYVAMTWKSLDAVGGDPPQPASYSLKILRYDISDATVVITTTPVNTNRPSTPYSYSDIHAIITSLGDPYWPVPNAFNSGVTYSYAVLNTEVNTGRVDINIKIYINGSYLINWVRVLDNQKKGDLIKLFLYLNNWKMSFDKNVLKITNASEEFDFDDVINLNHSHFDNQDFEVIDPLDPLDDSIYSPIPEEYRLVYQPRTAYYNTFLSQISIEFGGFRVHKSYMVTNPGKVLKIGSVLSLPDINNRAYTGGLCKVYEITQDQDDTDWYNCKAYNIS